MFAALHWHCVADIVTHVALQVRVIVLAKTKSSLFTNLEGEWLISVACVNTVLTNADSFADQSAKTRVH
jgi:hypothetical protein